MSPTSAGTSLDKSGLLLWNTHLAVNATWPARGRWFPCSVHENPDTREIVNSGLSIHSLLSFPPQSYGSSRAVFVSEAKQGRDLNVVEPEHTVGSNEQLGSEEPC